MSAKASETAKKNALPHRMGPHGYHGLEEKLKGTNIVIVNGHTNEVVDITNMSRRTIRFLTGRSTRDVNGRFLVNGALVDVLNRVVSKISFILYYDLVSYYSQL